MLCTEFLFSEVEYYSPPLHRLEYFMYVLGYRGNSYVSKNTGKQVSGINIYLVDELSSSSDLPCAGLGWYGKPLVLWVSLHKFQELLDSADGVLLSRSVNVVYRPFNGSPQFDHFEFL